jgi:hypothetical protein
MSDSLNQLQERYAALCHAMQSGAAMKMNYDPTDTQPKHLRVGVNSAMVEHAALVQVLFDKGIISNEEYHQALCHWMEREVEMYKQWLSDRLGADINLG